MALVRFQVRSDIICSAACPLPVFQEVGCFDEILKAFLTSPMFCACCPRVADELKTWSSALCNLLPLPIQIKMFWHTVLVRERQVLYTWQSTDKIVMGTAWCVLRVTLIYPFYDKFVRYLFVAYFATRLDYKNIRLWGQTSGLCISTYQKVRQTAVRTKLKCLLASDGIKLATTSLHIVQTP
jgi:hypothetical protein